MSKLTEEEKKYITDVIQSNILDILNDAIQNVDIEEYPNVVEEIEALERIVEKINN